MGVRTGWEGPGKEQGKSRTTSGWEGKQDRQRAVGAGRNGKPRRGEEREAGHTVLGKAEQRLPADFTQLTHSLT